MLNLDSFTVGIALAGNLILGCIVFFAQRKSATSKLFLFLTIAISLWSLINLFSYNASNRETALILVRLVLFFAVPVGTLFFLFSQTFPSDKFGVRGKYTATLIFYSIMVMALTLTPFVFSSVEFTKGSAPKPVVAPGIIVFTIVPVLTILLGTISLIRRAFQARKEEKKQYQLLTYGVVVMFSLIIVFNFIFPSFLNNTKFIPYSAFFTLPFVTATAYAIFRHHLLNLKIIATEALIFALTVATSTEIIFSTTLLQVAFRLSITLLVLGVGISLIRSVRNEVQQREQLEILTRELNEANKKLKALDQARAEFISIASHQLRTPPATVKWYLSAIIHEDYGPLDSKVKEVLVKTERTNNLLISLIEDILNVSRIERGKMEFLFQKVDVLDLARITCEQLQPLAAEKSQMLEFAEPKGKIPELMADREKLRQVMNNMIDNAIKYTPHNGHIRVTMEQKGDEVRFSVSDNGKGISAEDRESIFQKYMRGKESIKQSAGLGLGMYVAKVIIEQHQGKIWAESPGEGKGSSFIFSLPIHTDLQATTFDFAQIPQ